MKSLDRVQKVVKIAKIVAVVCYWCGCIGAVCCAIGALLLGVLGEASQVWNWIVQNADEETKFINAVCDCVCGVISCGVCAYLASLAKKLFVRELELGTPFDKDLVKQTAKLGLTQIISAVVASIVCAIICAIFGVQSAANTDFSIGAGIVYLLIALLCDLGADCVARADKSDNDTVQ